MLVSKSCLDLEKIPEAAVLSEINKHVKSDHCASAYMCAGHSFEQ